MSSPTISLPARTSGEVVADAVGDGDVAAADDGIDTQSEMTTKEKRVARARHFVTRGIYTSSAPYFNICSRPASSSGRNWPTKSRGSAVRAARTPPTFPPSTDVLLQPITLSSLRSAASHIV